MLRLLLQELDLFLAPLLVVLALLLDHALDGRDLGLLLGDLLLLLLLAFLEHRTILLKLFLPLHRLQLLPHRERHRAAGGPNEARRGVSRFSRAVPRWV